MKSVATFTWKELESVSKGEIVSHHRPFESASVDTDTRTFEEGSFFIPLSGENFNGNAFIEKAYESGAEGAFVSRDYLETHAELRRFPNLIAVADPLATYLSLANFHRKRSQARIVGITGSSGKTTTKEMLYTMLASILGDRIQKTEKNFNNEVGVAITLLSLRPETEVLVVEMAMRGLGQIAVLSEAAEPDISIITNIGPAHIGLLGSLEAIAQAKCEISKGMDPASGFAIINGDDALLVKEAGKYWNGCTETYSLHEVDDIHTMPEGGLSFQYEGITFKLGLPGSHNVLNALACIKACENMGVPLKRVANALENFVAGGGRWEKSRIEGSENLWMINDAYNANPASMKVALAAFMDTFYPGLKKVAVIGSMAELGPFSEQYHREMGEWISSRDGLDGIIVIGEEAIPLANAIALESLPTFAINHPREAIPLIQQHWPQDTIFFLKASRAAHLEEIPSLLNTQSSHALS